MEETLNLFNFCKPGLYEIKCIKTNKVYIGQSENCAYRIGRHFNDLKEKTHHCEPLLDDFLKYGKNTFEAKIITGIPKNKVCNEQNRKKLEEKRIAHIGPLKCYNMIPTNKSPVYKSYKYKSKIFNTIKELREFINHSQPNQPPYSETHFKRLFINKNSPRCNEIQFVGQRSQSDVFLIQGQKLNGWQEVVAAGLAKTKSQVFYRLNSSNYKTWIRFHKTKKRTGFKHKQQGYLIYDVYYKNANDVVKAGYAEDINKVYYRVSSLSLKWKDWKNWKR